MDVYFGRHIYYSQMTWIKDIPFFLINADGQVHVFKPLVVRRKYDTLANKRL